MQKFSNRTCANKKPKQKKLLLSLRFLHCNHNSYNVHCSITGRLGMVQLRCALRRMDGGLKLLVPEIWGAQFLQVHRMTKTSHLWPPRFQEGTALMPEKQSFKSTLSHCYSQLQSLNQSAFKEVVQLHSISEIVLPVAHLVFHLVCYHFALLVLNQTASLPWQ